MKKDNFIFKKCSLLIIALFIFFGTGLLARAADSKVYLEVPTADIPLHSTFTASLFIDTTDPINALDLEVGYPKDVLKFISSDNTGSIVNIWQTNPKDSGDGEVHLAGGILTSFTGTHGLVIRMNFQTIAEGSAQISFLQNNVYIADGKGTKLNLASSPATVSIKENAPPLIANTPATTVVAPDTTPPVLDVAQTTSPADGSLLIAFQASDAETGIKETDIRIKKWFAYSDWIPVQDPVVRPHGAWNVELRAVNNAGLSTVESIVWRGELVKKIIIAFFLLCSLVFVIVWVYNNRK